ncbi:GGDEF domain-containing protein [Vogesella sp. LYT5W]|uniref:diguanylate cyclase n=1 Tax=Vogesella margarita TaxID=2984199 RepID=A0ABT5IS44_9NEIS|nr:GGDEF domain-containing protein [Vogesella margarita]MDC7715396.1 GGDEF domain-containing protein [Vogesella margarita]
MHSPTLVAIAAILMVVMTLMLAAAWRFNPRIAGLGAWTLSYFFGLLVCVNLLLRAVAPELLLVLLTQLSAFLMAWLNWVGTRAYVGAAPVPRRYGVLGAVLLLATAAWFTVVQPEQTIRFTLMSLVVGTLFLLCARTIAQGRLQDHPARYLYALASGGHGLFLLLRPWLFRVGNHGLFDAQHAIVVSHLVVVESIAAIVLMAFGIVMLANEQVTLELRRIADRDPLTGVFNRRAFLALLDKGSHYAERMAFPLSVLLVDLDHFKKVNDNWGHQLGDRALHHFVTVAQACLRDGDVIGRLGGEEFAIFLPNARLAQAEAIASRLRGALEMQPLRHGEAAIALTASIGVAQRQPQEAPQALLHRADEAMYLAKHNGRNRIELAASSPSPADGTATPALP